MDGIILDTVTEEKDVRVLTDEELTFDQHVSAAISKSQPDSRYCKTDL